MTTTGTAETDRPAPVEPDNTAIAAQAIVDRTCADAWLAIEWSTKAPDWMIEQVKANNRARVAWGCPP